jgi:hypothetical protein
MDNSLARHSLTQPFVNHQRRGWWSDQLQNKDDTLVAGQSKSLSVSVGAAEQIPAWIPLDQITTPGGLAAQVKSNIYVCEFNPQRAQVLCGVCMCCVLVVHDTNHQPIHAD